MFPFALYFTSLSPQANWNSMTANGYRNIHQVGFKKKAFTFTFILNNLGFYCEQIEDSGKGNFRYTMNSRYASDAPFRSLLNKVGWAASLLQAHLSLQL